MKIAIDVMGGDDGAEQIIPAALHCAGRFPDLQLTLVGNATTIENILSRQTRVPGVSVKHAPQVVEMSDRPSAALRRKQQSSMYYAIGEVKSGYADACVSAGNTGALMAISRHILRTLPGIERPAIIKAIPSTHGRCYLLDLGANIGCSANNLIQFAAMGSLMCGAVEGIERPRVGLLNIGEEEIKGEDQVRIAAERLGAMTGINFIGFVEGDGIYQSDADVIVCDGWVGNIALKTSEGLARFVAQLITEAFSQNIGTRTAALVAHPVLQVLRAKLRPEKYNGATLLGLNGIVVKSHGRSTEEGFFQAIVEARREVQQGIPDMIRSRLDGLLNLANR